MKSIVEDTSPIGASGPARAETDILASIRARLRFLYPDEADTLADDLVALVNGYRAQIAPRAKGWSERDVFLTSYGDTICKEGSTPLQALGEFLRTYFGNTVSMVHLLPHFPFSSDDGFSVIDYRQVRPDLGGWDDISKLETDYRLVFDAVVNHASQHSDYVKGHCSGDPRYKDFAVVIPPGTDTSSVLRTRSLPLLHPFETVRGTEMLWTTFSADQVDLNFHNSRVLLEMTDLLFFYASHGASVLRLDAIPYLWKELGTSCAHLPQTHEVIKLWRDLFDLAAPHVLLLTETNVPHQENVSYFGDRGDEAQIIYNFSLPPLVLWSLHTGDASVLTTWAGTLEHIGENATYLNLTATHDGIGMRPTEGILDDSQRQTFCELARQHGGDITGRLNADGSISVYELNITYFDAINNPNGERPLKEQVDRFVVSQAVAMALMGIPAFYLPSMLGERNNNELVSKTGRARSINRSSFDANDLAAELAIPDSLRAQVVARIKRLLELRATLSAFHPDASQAILDQGTALFVVRRENQTTGQVLIACHNVTGSAASLTLPAGTWRDVIGDSLHESSPANVPAYSVSWFVRQ